MEKSDRSADLEFIALKAECIRRGKMLLKYRDTLLGINDKVEHEGDRSYFGSTNDVDMLKDISTDLDDFGWAIILSEKKERDLFAELKAANEKVRELETKISELATFDQFMHLRASNVARNAIWDHESLLGPLFSSTELGGEVGELQNVVKKLEREKLGIKGSRSSLDKFCEEAADVAISLDLLAMRYNVKLWPCIVAKFNATSKEQGFNVFLLDPAK